MEKKLSRLFDYQKYEGNSKLNEVIKDVDSRYPQAMELTDDELFNVNAAGKKAILFDEYNKKK
jgi:hypothetical protein